MIIQQCRHSKNDFQAVHENLYPMSGDGGNSCKLRYIMDDVRQNEYTTIVRIARIGIVLKPICTGKTWVAMMMTSGGIKPGQKGLFWRAGEFLNYIVIECFLEKIV